MSDLPRGEWTSASNALADRLCPGRYQAQRDLPELPVSEEGDSGAVIHALWTGTEPRREPSSDERDKAEALREQEASVRRKFFRTTEGLMRLVERRIWHAFAASTDEPEGRTVKTSGQFDVALVHPESRRALICDGKSGWLPVPPNPSDLQLRRLAALLWLEIDCEEIAVCILKPFGKTEPPCVYTVSDLQRSVAEMEEDVRRSHDPEARRKAGLEQCRYCRAREECPARLGWLSAALPAAVHPLPLVSARDWTPVQRVLFLEREKEAREWLEDRKEEIKALLAETPDAVPGYGLRPGRTVESITDSQTVWARFCHDLGGTPEAFIKCIKLGKAALKEQVRGLTGHQGKKLDADMAALLAGCVEGRPSAPTIERLG